MPRKWFYKLVNPVDTATKGPLKPRTTSYWCEFHESPPSDSARISPPDTAFFRLHWTANPQSKTNAETTVQPGDLLFLVQLLRKIDRKGFSPARAKAIGQEPILVTHVVEVLDDELLELPDEWYARRVRAWFSAPYRVAPTTEELLGLRRKSISGGLACKVPGSTAGYRRQVLERLELTHLEKKTCRG